MPHKGICASAGRDKCAHTHTAVPPQDAHVTSHTCTRAQTLWVRDTLADGPDTAGGACSLERPGPQPRPSLKLPAGDSPSALRAPAAAVRGHPSPTALRSLAERIHLRRSRERAGQGSADSAVGWSPLSEAGSRCLAAAGAAGGLAVPTRSRAGSGGGRGGRARRQSSRAAWRGCGPGGAPGSRCWRCLRWASA